jgi:hypothetical protein
MGIIRPSEAWVVNSYNDFMEQFFGTIVPPKEAGTDGTDQELIEEVINSLHDAEYSCTFIENDRVDDYFIIQKFILGYWSIFDHDCNKYLEVCKNSRTRRECFINYLGYRQDDLGDWWKCNKKVAPNFYEKHKNLDITKISDKAFDVLFKDFCREASDNFVEQDMELANFSIVFHHKKI